MLLNWTTVIVRVYMAVSKSTHWPKHVMPSTIGGAVAISTSGHRLTSLRHQQQQTQTAFKKDVTSRQLSVHFGSTSKLNVFFLQRLWSLFIDFAMV